MTQSSISHFLKDSAKQKINVAKRVYTTFVTEFLTISAPKFHQHLSALC